MSLSSTSTIKSQLSSALGAKAPDYLDTLNWFITGKISRSEFDDLVRQLLDVPSLIQLHNALIISLFDASSYHRIPTPPPDAPKIRPRKRRRTLPYQGPGLPEDTLRSARLKTWSVSVGKRDRERFKSFQGGIERPRPRREVDEIARERGVVLLPERGDPPGSRLPLQLASVVLAPTHQHISDRINLISAQHNLGAPPRTVASLMMLAFETKLKQLITHAITLTTSSHAISSISPSTPATHQPILTASSFDTLFTVSPADLPNQSASAMRLAMTSGDDASGLNGDRDEEMVGVLKDREVKDPRWQMVALLGERSTVKEALRSLR